MFVYELWVRVVGNEIPWSRVACKSFFFVELYITIIICFSINIACTFKAHNEFGKVTNLDS